MWWALAVVCSLGLEQYLTNGEDHGVSPVRTFDNIPWIYPALVPPTAGGGAVSDDVSSRRARQLAPPLPPLVATPNSDIPEGEPTLESCPGEPRKLFTKCQDPPTHEGAKSLHDYSSENLEKSLNVSLNQYAGKVLLVVNLAGF